MRAQFLVEESRLFRVVPRARTQTLLPTVRFHSPRGQHCEKAWLDQQARRQMSSLFSQATLMETPEPVRAKRCKG
ncbi:hypothetical protein EVAR_57913_1 [Eumeta japonica]|uniref:Uncharacterized protein n=1 Tax=Eumeta variegata TaxID=151549 RepID=A0A4C1ZNF1_EUMVA|nr:hypothetical protein EVAR_57913_1 [Eumeta japonica]